MLALAAGLHKSMHGSPEALELASEALAKNPGLNEEQMRMMEENRRKAIERKRKSEQAFAEQVHQPE